MSEGLEDVWRRLKLAEARVKACEMHAEQMKVTKDLVRKQAFLFRFLASI